MEILQVSLRDRSYPIYIGNDLLSEYSLLKKHIFASQACIVTNRVIADLYLEPIKKALSEYHLSVVILPDGEENKTLEQIDHIVETLLTEKHSRTTTLIALGGGIIGDITGFAAASYQRGVQFIQIPTTLLAQVDSSVGGKTGVNHRLGKNMIGAFYQPQAVIADTSALNSLPEKEISAGLAEVIKYGLIRDADFFMWLEKNIIKLMARETDALIYAIKRSCAIKASIVAADECEKGVRAWLNLGHTFGHAIETATHYKTFLHGEAVAIGLLMAADLSYRHGDINNDEVERIKKLLQAANLPITIPETITADQLYDLMLVDKKAIDGQLRLVLLKQIGNVCVTSGYDEKLLQETLQAFTKS